MPSQHLSCSNGHSWEVKTDPTGAKCPVCGSPAADSPTVAVNRKEFAVPRSEGTPKAGDSIVELVDPDPPVSQPYSSGMIVFDSLDDVTAETLGESPSTAKPVDDSPATEMLSDSNGAIAPTVNMPASAVQYLSRGDPGNRSEQVSGEISSRGPAVTMEMKSSDQLLTEASQEAAAPDGLSPTLDLGPREARSDAGSGEEKTVMELSPRRTTSPGNTEIRGLADFGYEILGELGRGGMGVVYKARQVRLNRIVALKMILAGGHANQKEISRFRSEAEAVAQFQHPNIVQIYEIGESGDCPYFSLEYVNGGSLSQKVARDPLTAREAAQMVRTLAGAMDYAHQRGIIHRDLKPANILLTSDNQPKVTDFGLAKRFSEDTGQTRTGAVLGTPSYMAPEQAQGRTKEVGPSADIYSLGAILYDLLTGRPPFRGETVIETLLQVKNNVPLQPRRLQPNVPRDLETICLKCLEKEGHRRYKTAGDMAEDLRRFLENEPIAARPATTPELAWKWAKRHPTLAGLYAVLALLFLGGFAGSLVYANQKSALAEQKTILAEQQTKLAETETAARIIADQATATERQLNAKVEANFERANNNFEMARSAVDILVDRVVGMRLAKEPGLETLKKDLLEQALNYYNRFLHEKSADPNIRYQTGRAYFRIGDIKAILQQSAEAEVAYRQAIKFFEDPPHPGDLGSTEMNLALVYRDTGRDKEAAETYAHAEELWKKLIATDAAAPEYKQKRALSLAGQGLALRKLGKAKEAERAFQAAAHEQETLVSAYPKQPDYRKELGDTLNNQGDLKLSLGQAKEAQAGFEKSSAIFQELLKEESKNPGFRQGLALSLFNRAQLLRDAKPEEAKKLLNHAIAIRESLVADYKTTPVYRQELAKDYDDWGVLQQAARNYKEADQAFQESLKIKRKLADDFTFIPDYRLDLGVGYNRRATFLLTQNRLTEAEETFNDAVRRLTNLMKDFPERVECVPELARTYASLAGLYQQLRRPKDVAKTYQQALALWEGLTAKSPNIPGYQLELARTCLNQATFLNQTRDFPEAEKKYETARGLLTALAEKYPNDPDYRYTLAICYNNLARLNFQLQKPQEREDALKQGVTLLTKLSGDAPGALEYKQLLANVLGELGQAQAVASRLELAEENFKKSVGILEDMVAKFPDQIDLQQNLVTQYYNLSETLRVLNTRGSELDKVNRRLKELLDKLVVAFPKYPTYQSMIGHLLYVRALKAAEDDKQTEARDLLQESIVHLRSAADLDPNRPDYRQSLGQSYLALLDNIARLEDRRLVATTVADIKKVLGPTWGDYYRVAGYLCRCVAWVKKDTSLPVARREDLVNQYSDEAMKILAKAVESGFKDVQYLNTSGEIAPLRSRGDFKALVAEVEKRNKSSR